MQFSLDYIMRVRNAYGIYELYYTTADLKSDEIYPSSRVRFINNGIFKNVVLVYCLMF